MNLKLFSNIVIIQISYLCLLFFSYCKQKKNISGFNLLPFKQFRRMVKMWKCVEIARRTFGNLKTHSLIAVCSGVNRYLLFIHAFLGKKKNLLVDYLREERQVTLHLATEKMSVQFYFCQRASTHTLQVIDIFIEVNFRELFFSETKYCIAQQSTRHLFSFHITSIQSGMFTQIII